MTLVGILAADLSFNSSGFQKRGRTFPAALPGGRQGREGEKPGEVDPDLLPRTIMPSRPLLHHSYEDFYEEEYVPTGRMMGYPPCAHLLVILIMSNDEEQAIRAARRISEDDSSKPEDKRGDTGDSKSR